MEDTQKEKAPAQRTAALHSTDAAKKVRRLVKESYARAHQAIVDGRPVAWYMTCHINPIFLAMDIEPILPENWGALCAMKHAAEPYILKAESEGYSMHVCSYARIGMGYCSMLREGTLPLDVPDGGLAKPTMLIGSSAYCDNRFKWFQSIARYFDVPYYAFDNMFFPSSLTAFREDVRDQYIKYQIEQYRGLIEFMEKVSGQRMDWERLDEYVDTAIESWKVWGAAYEFRKAVPCPMGSEDGETVFVPGLLMEGQQSTLDFYKDLYSELKYRAENGIGAIPNEKYRLLWGFGLPPWHSMWMFNHFGDMGAVFVYEMNPVTPPDIRDMPESVSDPLERLALRDYTWMLSVQKRSVVGGNNFIPHSSPLEAIEPYKVDGVVFHSSRSCRSCAIGAVYYQDLVQQYSGVPTLMLESDMCDLRDFSAADWTLKMNAFVETVDTYKQAQRR